MNIEKLSTEFVKDLIPLINSLGNIPKTATVKYGTTRFSYVPLDDIMAKIKANNSFAFMQPLGKDELNNSIIQCVLIHSSGESIISDPFILPIKDGMKPQDIGSVLTYFRRYSASAFFGIASDEDNDAQPPEIAQPHEKCDECGKDILGVNGASPERIINGSLKAYGRKLCYSCCEKEKAKKEGIK